MSVQFKGRPLSMLRLGAGNKSEVFIARKISNKGKAWQTLRQMVSAQRWRRYFGIGLGDGRNKAAKKPFSQNLLWRYWPALLGRESPLNLTILSWLGRTHVAFHEKLTSAAKSYQQYQ